MACGPGPLSIDAGQRRGAAREAPGSPRRAFVLGVLAGGLACVGLASVALYCGRALAPRACARFLGAGAFVPAGPSRAGLARRWTAQEEDAAPTPGKLLQPLVLGGGSGGYTLSDPRALELASRAEEILPALFDGCTEDEKNRTNECYRTQKKDDPNAKIWRLLGDENLGNSGAKDQKETLDLKRAKLRCLNESKCIRSTSLAFIDELMNYTEKQLAPWLLREIGEKLGCDLNRLHENGKLVYRLANYPERPAERDTGSHSHDPEPRCGSHTDQSTISINLMQSKPGLEVKVAGEWHPVPAGKPVVMVGDMLHILSNDGLAAHEHRVVDAPAGEDGRIPRRVSLVVFVDMDRDQSVEPCVQPGDVPRFESGHKAGDMKQDLYWRNKTVDDYRLHEPRAA